MEVNSSIETIGIHDLYLVNLSDKPVSLGLNLVKRTGGYKLKEKQVYGEITITLLPKEKRGLTTDSIAELSKELFSDVTKAHVPESCSFMRICREYQNVTPWAICLDPPLDCALVVLSREGKDEAFVYVNEQRFARKTDDLISMARESGDILKTFWKCLAYDDHFIVNRERIMGEFQMLGKHEDEMPILEYHWSMIYQLLNESIVEISAAQTKAGEPETIFTEDPQDSYIPKNLHQIYFGCDPVITNDSGLPANFEECVLSCVDKHCALPAEEPWNHRIWTLKECWKNEEQYEKFASWCEGRGIQVKNLSEEFHDQEDWVDFYPVLKEFLERKNWGLGSDFVRYLLLKEYGGVYLDLDVRCHHRFNHTEVLNSDFFAGFDENQSEAIWVEGAIIGAAKGSEIMTKMIHAIRTFKRFDFFNPSFVDGYSTLYLTGPVLLTLIVGRYLSKLLFPRIYPPSFFYGKLNLDLCSEKSLVPSTSCIAFHSSTKTWLQGDQEVEIDISNDWKRLVKQILKK